MQARFNYYKHPLALVKIIPTISKLIITYSSSQNINIIVR